MDKGAHFYKCDFQVHSPRDRAWAGNKFGASGEDLANLSEEEKRKIDEDREQFAKEYLEKVRDAGLNAIAVTDHHDVVFSKIIRRVAERQNDEFSSTNQFDKLVTVFPGIELTLANPVCQCIIIFDSDFTDGNLDSVLTLLGITPSDEYDRDTVRTQRISQEFVNDLSHLHKKLDELLFCRDRYIVLPNCGKGGEHSILRNGFHEHYRKMPCVGGYVDKSISSDTGYQNKISGGDVNYGNKSIAILSTSDNRYEDGRELGKYSTWIKWAESSAEAIRQACLAKESRIAQEEPELPQIFLHSIDVTNSKFLGTFSINLSRQYNALIGGRGTGKSTILEYIRWGLCDQGQENLDSAEVSTIEKRRDWLVKKTLTEVGGEVRISMEKNGILHIVKRNSQNGEVFLKIGDSEFKQVKEEDIRRILPVQAYSQKQLSDVGVRTEELKRFIEQPIIGSLELIKFNLVEIGVRLKNSYTRLVRKKIVQIEIEKFNLESESLNGQANNLRKNLKGVPASDQEVIAKKVKIDKEDRLIKDALSDLSAFKEKAYELVKLLEKYPESIQDFEQLENKDIVGQISEEIALKFSEIKSKVLVLQDAFSQDGLAKLNTFIQQWTDRKVAFDSSYEEAKRNSQSGQQQLSEIQRIEGRLAEISGVIAERRVLLKEIGEPETEFETERYKWRDLHNEKILLLNERASKFTELSRNYIKAEITRSVNLSVFKNQLKVFFEGTRIREERIDAITDSIKNSDEPIKQYVSIVEEFRQLVELNLSDDKSPKLPITPILSGCGFNEDHKAKLSVKMKADDWLALLTAELDFDPEFYYNTNSKLGDVIPFKDASAGQQATALLTVLLNQPGIPLLIDQPEDDIDNRAIDQIIRSIWDAKRKRQLIFTSHNANLVVNGDAELVMCCDYRDTTSQTRGVIKAEGAIDRKIVRAEITSVMEGGEKAFKLRKDKYGF